MELTVVNMPRLVAGLSEETFHWIPRALSMQFESKSRVFVDGALSPSGLEDRTAAELDIH